MAVVASATGAAVFGLSGVAAGLAGGALLGAGAGALYSGITGDGNILNSALTGALLGGAVGGLGAGFAGMSAAGGTGLTTAAPLTGTGALAPGAATTVSSATPALAAAKGSLAASAAAPSGLAATQAAAGLGAASAAPVTAYGTLAGAAAPAGLTATQAAAGLGAGSKAAAAGLTGNQMLGYGLAGTTALSLLGGQQRGPGAGQMPDPGMIRPYNYSSAPNEPTGTYPSPYATAEYNEAGNPILDTRERNYFSQGFSPMEPYSAKTGTVNPNIPVTMAARGGLMFDDESGMDEARGLMQGNLQKGLFGMGYAEGGEVDLDQERNKLIMKNIKSASTKDLEKIMGAMNQQEFLMKNMPNYAQAMSPTISGMVEGAQYGDRMTRAYEDIAKKRAMEMGEKFVPQENYARIQPTMVNPQSGTYGGIASIGRQIDPNTRVNAMANIQRTPYDRNAMESVRRLGVGVDRQLGRDTNLSAFYEQDPMGRDKMGGARLTQRFEEGGSVKHMFGGGLSEMISKLVEQNPNTLTKYEYDNANQRYSTVNQPQSIPNNFLQMFGGAMGAKEAGLPTYRFDPAAREYQALAAGGHLGGYSDGGRMLKGPGDGMSDDIPGVIGNKQPARLADGEFVVPADVVSHLGNGSTDAGAKRLYAMMDEVRRARTGNKKQGKKIKAEKYLPA
jgi:hypothetical protein